MNPLPASEVQGAADELERHLELFLRAYALRNLPAPTAVILYGSYGRGEGGWFIDQGGVLKPYNDYDLCVVTHKRIPDVDLNELKRGCSKEIGIRWVDLCQFRPKQLGRLRPSIMNYDLKNGATVIQGDPAILQSIPEIDGTALAMKEAQTLFFTRLFTLLGSLGPAGFEPGLEGEESRFFRNQMAKAILAAVDVLLLGKGAYVSSYVERVDKLATLFPWDSELLRLSRWALDEKLNPSAPTMSGADALELYDLAHRHFFAVMYKGLSLYFRREVAGPEDLESRLARWPALLAKRAYSRLRFFDRRAERLVAVWLAQCYVAAAWTRSGIDAGRLSRGVALLRRVDGLLPKNLDWHQARLQAARLRGGP